MCGAAGLFALLNAAAKSLAGDLPMVELLWARTAGHLAFVVAAFGPRYGRRLFHTRHPTFQLARSLLLLGSTAFNFAALRQLLGAASTGYLIFGDVPGPELWFGALLIVASGLSIAYAETRRPATG